MSQQAPPNLTDAVPADVLKKLKDFVRKNNAAEVRSLIDSNSIDVTLPSDKYGGSLLHDAITAYAFDIIQLLIDSGVDVNTISPKSFGRSPLVKLFESCVSKKVEDTNRVLVYLLDKGGNPNLAGNAGLAALETLSCRSIDNPEAAALLLAKGASTSQLVENYNFNTNMIVGGNVYLHKASALHLAAAHHLPRTVCALLDGGASATLKDFKGKTARDVVEGFSAPDVVLAALLEKYEQEPCPSGPALELYLKLGDAAKQAMKAVN